VTVSLRVFAVSVMLGAVACGGTQTQASQQADPSASSPSDSAPAAAAPAGDTSAAVAPEADSDVVAVGPFAVKNAQAPSMARASKDELVTVVVELSGSPVAVVQAQAVKNEISDETREAVAQELRVQQRPLFTSIEAYGGQVMATYQHALNGIKVRLPASRVGSLALLPGVVGIRQVGRYHTMDDLSMPYLNVPAVWQGPPGFHGEGINVADIDTGIDYTHANFAGPGTVAAYQAAFAADTLPADPTMFGPTAPRVKGGTDLVGDHYGSKNADGSFDFTPHPDSNPLDCGGHGSHTAGTIAGSGVTTAGATYAGPYDNSTFVTNTKWMIGPGVAPKANIYAIRVFGCGGSTEEVTDAIEWAMDSSATGGHPGVKIQAINMSLGSDYGNEDSSDALASTNAANAGIIVVAASGNAGNIPFITSSPGDGAKVISVAAVDSHVSFPGATLTLTNPDNSTSTITVQNNNAATFADGLSGATIVAQNNAGEPAGIQNVGLGCLDSDYANVAGKIVVAARGTCARIYRVQAAFHHGAVAAILVNNASGFGTFEGDVQSCIPGATPDNASGRPCDAGETPVLVTIPMFGVQGVNATTLSADAQKVAASTSISAANKAGGVANPTANAMASFSSAGPRQGYNADGVVSPNGHLKPNISGPGVSINSTGVGTGNQGVIESGTSMATPHVTGSAVLALQSHPVWSPDDVRLAIENTASPTSIVNYAPRNAGGGLVQPFAATRTSIVARADADDESNLSWGAIEISSDYSNTRTFKVTNLGTGRYTFNATATKLGAIPHTVTVTPSTFTLAGGSSIRLSVNLAIPAATAGSSSGLREVSGYVTITPASGGNGGAVLNFPYYAITHARSDVQAAIRTPFSPSHPNSTMVIHNNSGAVTGNYDFYSWGSSGTASKGAHGIRAVGVKSSTSASCPAGDKLLTFAINTWKSNPTYDGRIDAEVDMWLPGNTGTADYAIYTQDVGQATGTGAFNGQIGVITLNVATGAGTIKFLATAPFDSSIVLMPVCSSDIGLSSAGTQRFSYVGFTDFGTDDPNATAGDIPDNTGFAQYNPFTPALSATVAIPAGGGMPANIAPLADALLNVNINPTEWAQTPTKGAMIISRENPNGGADEQALVFTVAQH
jgi:minor extracellular serine protease Vpr